MELEFATDYLSILEKIDRIDPIEYGKSRNYIDGAVTYLSPYISRGVISTKQVLEAVLKKGYKLSEIESFAKELCWRDYFQRVAQTKDLTKEIKQAQHPISNYEIPTQIINANTGIDGIDNAIKQLYQTGYMHNHCRMYTASLVCNLANSNWLLPAKWMYYHLLDGDWASNACSWQWVAAANSSKKYYANQENINKYTQTNQLDTYLDKSYDELTIMDTPKELLVTQHYAFELELPETNINNFNKELPTYIYNYYNLDPLWHKETKGNRILLIEPSKFEQYPVSKKCIDFMLALSKNIDDMQIYVGSFSAFQNEYTSENIYYKEHPFNTEYTGNQEERDWIVEEVTGYYPSFFAYWKQVENI